MFIGTSGDETGLDCVPVSNVYLTLLDAHEKSREIYATLLAAQITGGLVKIRIVNNTDGCAVKYVLIQRAGT